MISKIFSAIGDALKSGFMALGRCATAPFRFLFGSGGGGGPWGMRAQAPSPVVDERDPLAEHERRMTDAATMANLLMGYAADSVIDQLPARLPDGMSDEVKRWARGLSYEECKKVLASDERGITAHLMGLFPISGLRTVQYLPQATWSRKPKRGQVFEPRLSAAACFAP